MIIRLPELVINQIAAGEVVENGPSAVKELIENSLDAGASSIEVTFEEGLIRIEDDGCGMNRQDAVLCLERHATSKLRTLDDLEALLTMGFRGEALAAIASVSKLELKTSDGQESTRIAEGAIEPCARNRGTTIEVRELFYNTPARKKFQKSHSADAAAVRKIVEMIALAHPEVAFCLKGKCQFLKATAKERIEEILGPQPHEVSWEKGSVKIWGFLSQPRSNRTGQYLYINRRPVVAPLVSKAVKQGFGTRIAEKDHPSFILFLEISPDAVDVNVHPQKKEVRFRDEGMIFRFFEQAVASAFKTPAFAEPIDFEIPPIQWKFQEPIVEDRPITQTVLPLRFAGRILTVRGSFLWVEKEDLMLVDLKAAQARVLFEELQANAVHSQALMIPQKIELSREEAHQGEEWANKLCKIGIECRFLGPRTLIVDAVPTGLDDFARFFEEWKTGGELRSAASRFCKGRKQAFSLHEAGQIWEKLQQCSDSRYDPLGQPIWKTITEGACEKWIRG